MLPTSRYTANTDRGEPEDSALNTINSLPRTPNEAGLIGVQVKQKLAFKNTHHKAQMINVEKIYKAIDHLKKAGNPYYQFYDGYHTYEERCVNSDSDNIISKSLHDAWDEEIIKDFADLDINMQSDYDGVNASKPQSEKLLQDVSEGDTYIATVSTTPAGFEQYVNVMFIISIFELNCKEIIYKNKEGDEGETCISMCEDPAGFEHCDNIMIIDVIIPGKTIHWIVCGCEGSTVPLVA